MSPRRFSLVAVRRSRFGTMVLLASCLLIASCASRPVANDSGSLRIYLARHGQTDWNAARRVQGGTDTPLNATGVQQAQRLAARLKGIPLDAVYSSTLSRSKHTADIVRGSTPLKSLPGLAEQQHGKFEGKLIDGSDPALLQEFQRRTQDPTDALDGGESLNQLFERVRAAVQDIRKEHSSGTILIVGHGGANRMIVQELMGLSGQQARQIVQANDDVYLIEVGAAAPPRMWKLITESNLRDLYRR
jgi:2,3-bisphosphoglycerate-dependent phosphoglycerate mutase